MLNTGDIHARSFYRRIGTLPTRLKPHTTFLNTLARIGESLGETHFLYKGGLSKILPGWN
jgi:hypothetical protein